MNFTQARINMVDSQIQTAGITSEEILKSFENTPREIFVPEKIKEIAYCDEELSIGNDRYLLEPLVHGKMIQAAHPEKSDVVLDIGAATGYSSAILAPLVTTVVALESESEALDKAGKLWSKLDACNIAGIGGALPDGAPDHAPFSLIVINGAVTEIPGKITDQLTDNGRLIAIVTKPGEIMGEVTLVKKNMDGAFSTFPLFDANAHYLPGFESSQDFHF